MKSLFALFFLFVLNLISIYPQFTNVTESALGFPPGSVTGRFSVYWVDINNDGLQDFQTSPYHFYLNNGDGTFTLRDASDLQAIISTTGLHRSTFADTDNDGDMDFIITPYYGYTTYFIENQGAPDYTFTGSVIFNHAANVFGGQPTFIDGNNDGIYECYLGMLGSWDPYAIGSDRYMVQSPVGTWHDSTAAYIPQLETGLYKRPTRGTVAADFDNDNDLDIFVPVYGISWNENWEDILWENDGTGHFTDIAMERGVAIEPHGRYGIGLASGASWGDFDNDGDFDLVVANIHGWAALYRNDDGYFTNITQQAGLFTTGPEKQWHNSAWIDYDNDGDLDLFLTQWYDFNWSYVFKNKGPEQLGFFEDVTQDLGLRDGSYFGTNDGIGAADYDKDGDMDIAFYCGNPDTTKGFYLMRNDLNFPVTDKHWLVLEMKGNGTTTALTAHGTKIKIYYPDGTASGLKQVESSSGDGIMNMIPVHFGLGKKDAVHVIKVIWTDGTVEYFDYNYIGNSVDQYATLEQGTGSPVSNVLFVDDDNTGFEDGSEEHPYNTITEAVTAAQTAYVIVVKAGTYQGPITFNGKKITVYGIDGPRYTEITGNGTDPVISVSGSDESNNYLSGLTLLGGSTGLYIDDASPSVRNMIIRNNSGAGGGGITIDNGSPNFLNVLIYANSSSDKGGAVRVNDGNVLFNHVTASMNTAPEGGGIYLGGGSSSEIVSSIFWGNDTLEIMMEGLSASDQLSVSYSDIQGGQDSVHTGTAGVLNWGEGNINLNPLFSDPQNGDFRLGVNSPCNGTGERGTDMGAVLSGSGQVYLGPRWYVAVDGSDINGDGSRQNPFATIETGVTFARNGDTVIIAPGTYEDAVNMNGKNITLASYALDFPDSNFVESTVITEISARQITYVGTEDSTSLLYGFTFYDGNGIDLLGNASPVIENCRFIDNSKEKGGAIYVDKGSPDIINCEFTDNYASESGGGIFASTQSNITVTGCSFTGNQAVINGGAIAFEGEAHHSVEFTLFTNNSADKGGAMYFYNAVVTFNNITSADNSAADGAGIYILLNAGIDMTNAILDNDPADEIKASTFIVPMTINLQYSDVTGGEGSFDVPDDVTVNWGTGMIAADPVFCPSDTMYTISEYSPCNGTGLNGANMGAMPVGCTIQETGEENELPKIFALYDNYPNPFNPATTIRYDLPSTAQVSLEIYSMLGEKAAVLVNGLQQAGSYELQWNAAGFASGIYFYKLDAKQQSDDKAFSQVRKMLLLK